MEKTRKELSLVSFLYIFLIFLTTFPLLLKFGSCMPGFFSTDESFAVLWNAWLIKFSLTHKITFIFTDFVAYPFGIKLYSFFGFIFAAINLVLALFFRPVLVYNLQVVISLFLTALFTFCLVKYIIKDKLCAFFSGVIFSFCPYIFMRSWQHIGAVYLWPIPLFLWFALRLRQEDSFKVKFLFVISLICGTVNFDVTYYLLVIYACLLAYSLPDIKSNFRYLKRVTMLMVVSFVILLPQFIPVIYNVIFNRHTVALAQNTFHRPFEDLFTQSAKPLSYFLPSAVHPIFGKFTEQFVGTELYGQSFTEHTLYLGWLPLILAFSAFKIWKKRKKSTSIQKEDGFYVGYFVLLAIVAWFFSQPPWWQLGPLKIYMPSFFMYKILPMIRAYCRFGVVVMFAVSVLAGFGLKFLLEKVKRRGAKIFATAAACVFVLFEFWSWPPYKVIDVNSFPAAYEWLKQQPKDVIIAEYPLDSVSPYDLYKLYQIKHEKKMINSTIPGTEANIIAKTLVKLSDRVVTAKLKEWKVKYALVHRERYLSTELADDKAELKNIPKNPDLRLIKSFPPEDCPEKNIMCIRKAGPIDIYEIK